jgi:hypothetical protein
VSALAGAGFGATGGRRSVGALINMKNGEATERFPPVPWREGSHGPLAQIPLATEGRARTTLRADILDDSTRPAAECGPYPSMASNKTLNWRPF